jgi:hypothetical protein
MALMNYLWGCYQALIGKYGVLQAENAKLQAENAKLQQCVDNAAQRVAYANERRSLHEQRYVTSEHKLILLKKRAADAEQRAAYAERCADHRRNMNYDLHKKISDLEFCVEYTKNDAYDAEQRADEAEQRAYDAKNELNALYEQQRVEALILHELSNDKNWTSRTSVSRVNFVKKQTQAVLNAQRETYQCQAKIDQLTQLMLDLKEQLPLDIVTQTTVKCPVILFPSLETLDPKIVNKESVFRLKNSMDNKFPIGHGATIQKVYECADLKNMFAAIQKFLKLCGRDLDE